MPRRAAADNPDRQENAAAVFAAIGGQHVGGHGFAAAAGAADADVAVFGADDDLY